MKCPEGYQLLKEGEVIRSGYIWKRPGADWQPVNFTGAKWNSKGFHPTARKITTGDVIQDMAHQRWRVTGDHPVMRRPDKVFTGPHARVKASVYAQELREAGYENVDYMTVDAEKMIECPSCKGTGKQTVKAKTYLGPGKWKQEPPLKIECINCGGTGNVDPAAQAAREKAYKDFWCKCGNPSANVKYYDDGEHPKCQKHCWVCEDCGKITQVG